MPIFFKSEINKFFIKIDLTSSFYPNQNKSIIGKKTNLNS